MMVVGKFMKGIEASDRHTSIIFLLKIIKLQGIETQDKQKNPTCFEKKLGVRSSLPLRGMFVFFSPNTHRKENFLYRGIKETPFGTLPTSLSCYSHKESRGVVDSIDFGKGRRD